MQVSVSVDGSDQFKRIGDSVDGDICIQPDDSQNIKVELKATALGSVNFTARAESTSEKDVCGSSTVYDGLAKDAISQPFIVEVWIMSLIV